MADMTKKERALRDHYHKGAREVVESFGGTMYRQGSDPDSPSAHYRLMTEYGRLDVHVYDNWTATAFDRPRLALAATGCNPYTGKWNHHCSGFGNKDASKARVDQYLDLLRYNFEKVGARKWEPVSVEITPEEIDASNLERLRDRQACGEIFTVVGFDKQAAAEEISSQVTDHAGERPDWLVRSNLIHHLNMSDLEAYVSLREWRAQLAQEAPSAPAP